MVLQSIACLRRFLEVGKAQRGVNNRKRLRRESERYKTRPLFSPSHLPHSYSSFRAIGDFTIHRRDGNENIKKSIGSEGKTTTLHEQLPFLCICLPFLHDCNVKLPNFTCYGRRKQATTKFYNLDRDCSN